MVVGATGLLCTLAGKQIDGNGAAADLAAISREVPDPPSLARASSAR